MRRLGLIATSFHDLHELKVRHRQIAVICLLGVTPLLLRAEDWPQWRGKKRDAVLHESGLLETLPGDWLPRRWSVPIGPGYSGPTVAAGRVYVTDRGAESSPTEIERVLCLDAEDGKLIWQHAYEAAYTIGYRAGPRAAVTLHDGKAISVGAMGHLKCLDAASGDVQWEHDLAEEYDVRMPAWGIAAAPLVYDDLVVQVAAGAGDACVVAFDLETGKERWHAIDERAGYSAPILIRQGDQDVVVCWTGESVTGLAPRRRGCFMEHPDAAAEHADRCGDPGGAG